MPKEPVKKRDAKKPTARRATRRKAAPAVTTEMIAVRAYHLWQNGAEGDPLAHWLTAERELTAA